MSYDILSLPGGAQFKESNADTHNNYPQTSQKTSASAPKPVTSSSKPPRQPPLPSMEDMRKLQQSQAAFRQAITVSKVEPDGQQKASLEPKKGEGPHTAAYLKSAQPSLPSQDQMLKATSLFNNFNVSHTQKQQPESRPSGATSLEGHLPGLLSSFNALSPASNAGASTNKPASKSSNPFGFAPPTPTPISSVAQNVSSSIATESRQEGTSSHELPAPFGANVPAPAATSAASAHSEPSAPSSGPFPDLQRQATAAEIRFGVPDSPFPNLSLGPSSTPSPTGQLFVTPEASTPASIPPSASSSFPMATSPPPVQPSLNAFSSANAGFNPAVSPFGAQSMPSHLLGSASMGGSSFGAAAAAAPSPPASGFGAWGHGASVFGSSNAAGRMGDACVFMMWMPPILHMWNVAKNKFTLLNLFLANRMNMWIATSEI